MIFRHLLNMRSHPTWVRGLKHHIYNYAYRLYDVAPYVGAWIETFLSEGKKEDSCRTLRGCVD